MSVFAATLIDDITLGLPQGRDETLVDCLVITDLPSRNEELSIKRYSANAILPTLLKYEYFAYF